MRKQAAFTLVELLVVIGIIALLISILLPALNRANQQAKRTVCTTQLREMATCVVMYASENKGAIPPYAGYEANPRSPYTSANGDAQVSFMIHTDINQYPDPITGDLGENGSGLGRLIVKKYLKSRKIMICPSLIDTPVLNGRDRVGYYFNPWPAYLAGTATAGGPLGQPGSPGSLTTRFKKLKDFRKDLPLISEFFYDAGSLAHLDKKNGSAYFTLVYPDGHAVCVNSKRAYENVLNRGGWNWNRVCDTIGMASCDAQGLGTRLPNPGTVGATADQSLYYYTFYPMVQK
jgi:prepilin-type N-terminal cleavage/methylation domain-containing protein